MFSRSILLGLALAAGADAFMTPSPMLARTGVRSAAVASPQLRAGSLAASTRGRQGVSLFMAASAEHMEQLKGCKQALWDLVDKTNANPIMVRLAWHDAGTYDVNIKDWPKCGGAIGSIRFDPEITHGANAGLASAIKMLEPIKTKFPLVSYADLFQMASAVSIEHAGGPKIDMKYGRVDAEGPKDCSPEGNLPDAEAGDNGKYGGAGGTASTEDTTPNGHLKKVFYRMGLGDMEIVALSGAHTLGRAWKDRSGLGADKTKFTDGTAVARKDGKPGIGKAGGSSWTEKWLAFDNSYFTTIPNDKADPELLKLSTDKTVFGDDGFKPFAEKYRDSQDAFFKDYAIAHKKLAELGSKYEPAEGITGI